MELRIWKSVDPDGTSERLAAKKLGLRKSIPSDVDQKFYSEFKKEFGDDEGRLYSGRNCLKLKNLEGFPKGVDLENCDIIRFGKDVVYFAAGGDWQQSINIGVGMRDGKLRVVSVFDNVDRQKKTDMKKVKAALGISKSIGNKALVIGVPAAMQKALNTGRLVRKQVDVNRGGQTFKQNRWVRPDEAGGSMPGAGTKDPAKEQKAKRGPDNVESGNAKKAALKVGDKIGYTANGQNLSGMVSQAGFVDGVIVKDERGKEHPVEWKNIHDPKDAGSGGNGSDGEGPDDPDNRLFSKTDAIKALFDAKNIKPGWRNGSDGNQPFNTIDDMYKMCEAAREPFLKMSQAVAARFEDIKPMLVTRPELKKLDRAKEKMREDGYYDPDTNTYNTNTMRDIDGHTFCVKDVSQVAAMLDYYDKQDKSTIRIKNNFAKPSPVGYSDINMNVKLPNGTIAEVQLNTVANIVAKEKYGHAMYEVYRSIAKKPEYAELAGILADGQKKLYAMSNEYSKNGTFPDIGNKNPFYQVEHEAYADAIRPFVAKAAEHFEKAKASGVLNPKTVEHFEHLLNMVGA